MCYPPKEPGLSCTQEPISLTQNPQGSATSDFLSNTDSPDPSQSGSEIFYVFQE